jgi:TolB-like protein/Flp pilus assembly protein TadD/DNA-binding winged helix-turn-helix (wHTH) protein
MLTEKLRWTDWVMDAADLRMGFKLGEWLVEPAASRISGPTGVFVLDASQLALLLELATEHGEAVSREALRRALWPIGGGSDHKLREEIRRLRELLGGSRRDRRYIVGANDGGFALIAHLEVLQPAATAIARPETRSLVGRLQAFVVELRRRNVFKVGGAYLVGMWIVLQVAETTFEPLHLPDWWLTGLTILAVLGLPIVTVLAWSYEITPGGIVLDEGANPGVNLPRARRAIAPVAVAGVSLMAAVTGIAWWRSIEVPATQAEVPPQPGQPSVAVLPLVDMSPGGGNEYLGDGLSEELSTRLAQVPGLRVAARTSAFEFKDRNLDVRRIGQALGVRNVLEGSVRRDGDSLRVTVQLIDAATGYHVWAGSYDRSWSDVILIQDEIARSITEALRVVLVPAADRKTETLALDVRAFDPYLAGLALLRQPGDLSRLREAGRQFDAAVAIAPDFARAYAGSCQVGLRLFEKVRDPADLERAEAACRRALELDPQLIETEKALAALYLASGRLDAAEKAYRALTQRNPQDADGHIGLGRTLAALGQGDAAEASFRAAVRAEPAYWGAYGSLGVYLLARGRLDGAVDAFREVTELAPSSASALNNLGAALQMKGDLAAAADVYRRSLAIEPSASAYSNLATMHYFLHEYAEAEVNYERATALASQDQTLWGNLGDALWQMPGRREEAIGHYRRAITLGQRELQANASNRVLVAQLGYYNGRVGDRATADDYLAKAATGAPDALVQYYRAVAAADRGDLVEARKAMEEAVELGYPPGLLRAEPSLAGVTAERGGS